jgi:beta-glucanase (GH16 family)
MASTLPTLPASALTFDDEFNTFVSSPDGSQGWMTTYPYTGEAARSLYPNSEAEYYSDPSVGENPFSDANGVLTISATPAAPGSNPYNLPYDSGLITTDTSFHQLYGYFEVSAELPAGTGLWPAFWMLPANNQYTSELDIFEVKGQDPTTIYSSALGSTNGAWIGDQQALSVADVSTGFHTYGVDWEPTAITFYVDGQEIAQAPTPASMDTPMFMLLNLAVGGSGSWSGPPNSSTVFPAQMKIDYVRAYATAATQDVGGSDAVTNFVPLGILSTNTSPISIGSGPDQLVLETSEDAWQGDAQYTISIDGVQVGGTLTATAFHAAGQDQTVTVSGNWGSGLHAVSVNFLNDDYGGTPSTDRNLYVDGASYDGVTDTPDTLALYDSGTQTLTVGTAPPDPSPVTLGNGPDALVLQISEDAWEGDAQYTVSVDGVQVGGTLTATAFHAAGQDQTVTVSGSWGSGLHTVSVNFLNDAYGGTPSTDRNLYVDGASYDGVTATPDTLELYHSGTQTLTVGTAQVDPTPVMLGSGPDQLVLQISEDAWEGDAQYTVSVDGVQVGGTLTANALHTAGQDQTVTVSGNWGSGPHAVSVDFLNDAYGGTPSTDRNLYVDGASYDGVTDTPDTLALYHSGTQSLTVGGVPAYSHIVLVTEENQDYSQIIGDTADAPYINSLAADGALLTNYDAITPK